MTDTHLQKACREKNAAPLLQSIKSSPFHQRAVLTARNKKTGDHNDGDASSKYSDTEAWKIISRGVPSYFDNLEMADQATGYMKTS